MNDLSEGDCRVLLARYLSACTERNAFRGDDESADARWLELKARQFERDCTDAMMGRPMRDRWHQGFNATFEMGRE